MGTKKGQVRKTARRAYVGKTGKGPRRNTGRFSPTDFIGRWKSTERTPWYSRQTMKSIFNIRKWK